MKKTLLLSLTFFLSSSLLCSSNAMTGQELPIEAKIEIAGHTIELEVAKTPKQQELGLMYRTTLQPNRGMLFVFSSAQYVTFWMLNTYIPLDMIFLRDGKVKYIQNNVPPCAQQPCPTYGPLNEKVDQVIELKGGEAAKLDLKIDTPLAIQYLRSSH